MNDKAGQLYAVLGGALLGCGLGMGANALVPGSFWWLLGTIGGLVIGLLLIVAVINRWRLPGRTPMRDVVVQEAYALSADILEWLKERRASEPDTSLRRVNWDAYNAASSRHDALTRGQFDSRYARRALRLFDQLSDLNAKPQNDFDRRDIEHAVNPLVMKSIAFGISSMAASVDRHPTARNGAVES